MKYVFQTVVVLLLCCFGISDANSQERTVRGVITSAEDGLPIIGATILLQGTERGTTTDFDGRFELTVADDDSVLVISYVGHGTQEIRIGDREFIEILLAPEASILEEVVVIGYGTQKRSNISGAVSTLDAEEVTETPVLRTEQALQGRTAGVQVAQNSGSPGSPLTVRIRGVGTINNSDPLYIVDGVPVDGIDFLNPNDIESINVLKDAASAAIYGARGANGVVLIETKGGEKNTRGTVSYDAYYGVQSAWRLVNLLNARQYAILQNEAHVAAGVAPPQEFSNPDLLGEGTDWLDAIFEDAPMMSHQLTVSGGSDRSTYSLSGNFFQQDGIVGGEKSGFDRVTVRLNTTHDVNEWLNVGNTLGVTNLQRNLLPENNEFTTPLVRALNMDPVTRVRKSDGTYAYSIYSDTDITNPVNAIANTFDEWTTNRLVGSLFAKARITDHLSVKSTFSTDVTFARRDIFIPLFDLSIDPVLSEAPAQEKNETNTVILEHNHWKNWQWENVLVYDRYFSEDHHTVLTLGTTALKNRFDFSGGSNTNLPTNDPDDAFISNTIDPIESQGAYSGATESSLFSVFGRVNYTLQDKYLFSATMRADGSSRFGANNRYGYFPSFSAGWVLSREDFFNSDFVSFLKLRASWGQNGNDRIGDYTFTTIVNIGQNYTFGPDETITNGSVPLVAANPDLQWETVTQTDIGVDVELLEGKVNVVSDYYIKKTSDMLYAAPVPLVAGTLPPVRNIGEVENTGIELSVLYRNRDREFKYSVGGNISFVSSEVISLGEGGEPVLTGRVQSANAFVARTEVGQPIASFYGYVTDGLFQTEEEIANHAFQNEQTAPGDIRFVDLNMDGIIDINDQTYIGDPTPDFTYGFTADLEYKGFDLGLFVQGVYGNEIYNSTVRYDFTYVNRPQSVLDRWTGPGTSNSEPRVSLNDPNQNARISDRFVEDGSYLRIKNVQLGYTLPFQVMERAGFQKLRVYVSAQNLLTLTDYSGMDPEIGAFNALEIGIDRGFYPQPRIFLFGVQASL